jgi:hypothetical protein
VSGRTIEGCESVRDAVASDTPAAAAMSANLGRVRRGMLVTVKRPENFFNGNDHDPQHDSV